MGYRYDSQKPEIFDFCAIFFTFISNLPYFALLACEPEALESGGEEAEEGGQETKECLGHGLSSSGNE